ncbi:Clr5 domain-containing protein [Saccharothrix saharensis]|uniref:Clr5 domain-containing protein n=1 Tax=Saccharothrix saharensis TaxID=571190 RepID=UPI001FEBDFC9|nr:Clr5 domain-containing protein [Saccharothrix saharensis]
MAGVTSACGTAGFADLVDTYGEAVPPVELDVIDEAAVVDGVRRAVEHFGRLDVVVNNAGYAQVGAVQELSGRELRTSRRRSAARRRPRRGRPSAAQARGPARAAPAGPLRHGFHPTIRQAYESRLKMWDDWQDLSADAQGGTAPTDA